MKTFNVFAKLLVLLKHFLPIIAITILFGLIGFLSAQAITVLASVVFIKFIGAPISLSYSTLFVSMIICGTIRGFLRYGEHLTGHYTAFKLLAVLRDKLFKKLRELSPAKLEGREKGNLISMVTSDIETLEVFYAHTVAPILIFVLHCTVMTVFFVMVVGWLFAGLALLGYLTIGIFLPLIAGKKIKEFGGRYRKGYSRFASFFMDSIYGGKVLLSLGKTQDTNKKIVAYSNAIEETNKDLKYKGSSLRAWTDISIHSFKLLFLIVGFIMLNHGLNYFAFLPAFVALLGSYGPSVALSALPMNLSQTIASGERVLGLLAEKPVVEQNVEGENLEYSFLALDNLCFSYGGENVLKGINYKFEKNKIYGICGESGSGKSTLLKLLMRFWDIEDGNIFYNGTNIKQINTESLRQNIAYMTQDTHIFNTTIKENIALGGDYSEEDIIRACKSAALWGFISGLNDGIETKAGELGGRLSGGERQRIGLARMFLHGGRLLLLDEPTSNVDALNEAEILKAVKNAKNNRSIILVSHRESALAICDVKLYMKNGVLMEAL